MKPNQTAPNDQSALGPYCLQYRLANIIQVVNKVLLPSIGY